MLRRLVTLILILVFASPSVLYAKPEVVLPTYGALPILSEKEKVLMKSEVLDLLSQSPSFLKGEAKKGVEDTILISSCSDKAYYLSKTRIYLLGRGASLEIGALLKVRQNPLGGVEALALVDKWVKVSGEGASFETIFFTDLTKSYPTDTIYLKGYGYLNQVSSRFRTKEKSELEALGYQHLRDHGLKSYYDKSFSFDFLITPKLSVDALREKTLAPLL